MINNVNDMETPGEQLRRVNRELIEVKSHAEWLAVQIEQLERSWNLAYDSAVNSIRDVAGVDRSCSIPEVVKAIEGLKVDSRLFEKSSEMHELLKKIARCQSVGDLWHHVYQAQRLIREIDSPVIFKEVNDADRSS